MQPRLTVPCLQACRGNALAVLRVYDTLLSQRGGDEVAEQAHLPIVRLALLRSQLNLMTPLARQLLDRPGIRVVGQSAGFRREVIHLCACSRSHIQVPFGISCCLNVLCCMGCHRKKAFLMTAQLILIEVLKNFRRLMSLVTHTVTSVLKTQITSYSLLFASCLIKGCSFMFSLRTNHGANSEAKHSLSSAAWMRTRS